MPYLPLMLPVLLALLLTGSPGLTIRVQPAFNGEALVLETHTYTTARHEEVAITAFRFYLSAIELDYADGTRYAEPASYHLLDAEKEGSLSFHLPAAPAKPIKRLCFRIGVDSAANTTGAHGGDLDPGLGMYWAWHSGYVNAKLEGRSPQSGSPRHEFEFHIGGFAAPTATLRRVELAVAVGAPLVLVADVARWLDAVSLAKTHSVLIPGAEAVAMADAYARMFSLQARP